MLQLLIALAGMTDKITVVENAPYIAIQPTVASTFAGQCANIGIAFVPAQITISWLVVNPNDADYETRVYENGALKATLPSSASSWAKDIDNAVEVPDDYAYFPWTSNWVYRVDIVRKADGVTVSRGTTAQAWVRKYGPCFTQII